MSVQIHYYLQGFDYIDLLNVFRGEYFVFSLDDHTAPLIQERIWSRKAFHYDNCAMAMITLFAVQTSEGWIA